MTDNLQSTRRAQLEAQYAGKLTPAQIGAVLADEALFRDMGEAVNAALWRDALRANGELPFVPLFHGGE